MHDALLDELAAEAASATGGAMISDCGRYRYWLERRSHPRDMMTHGGDLGPPMIFALCNPSTADATRDDPTVRRCAGFARREGHLWFIIVNPFAYRTTDPKGLIGADDPVGPARDYYVRRAINIPGAKIVVGWGSAVPPTLRHHLHAFVDVIRHGLKDIWCFGYTDRGDPRHPLYLPSRTPLEQFTFERGRKGLANR